MSIFKIIAYINSINNLNYIIFINLILFFSIKDIKAEILLNQQKTYILNLNKEDSHNIIQDVVMNIWTDIDLVRAINASEGYVLSTLDSITKSILYLYSLILINSSHVWLNKSNIDDIHKLVGSLEEALHETFKDFKQTDQFISIKYTTNIIKNLI